MVEETKKEVLGVIHSYAMEDWEIEYLDDCKING